MDRLIIDRWGLARSLRIDRSLRTSFRGLIVIGRGATHLGRALRRLTLVKAVAVATVVLAAERGAIAAAPGLISGRIEIRVPCWAPAARHRSQKHECYNADNRDTDNDEDCLLPSRHCLEPVAKCDLPILRRSRRCCDRHSLGHRWVGPSLGDRHNLRHFLLNGELEPARASDL